ncbi:MAG TPA: DUF2325 domain-containing protein [Candidatus Onthenecus intestinigallinarum]|uniref:DUF2325 domain-containing protein n=1 Tax=Candidatus Onthenecus intestinigallinarum TaxID=2840875 RepID=A0A9D0ZAG2_9FIRM|nr:DUF2325 domain-containing protein [Candidatus Onthenecus intestinigallinarum]
MSAIIIGGNECMGRKYVDVCRRYACEAKVFALKTGNLTQRLGQADLIFLCMDTVSHTMAQNAAREARRRGLKLIRLPKGSAAALEQALRRHVG